jgi:hypothetical protein
MRPLSSRLKRRTPFLSLPSYVSAWGHGSNSGPSRTLASLALPFPAAPFQHPLPGVPSRWVVMLHAATAFLAYPLTQRLTLSLGKRRGRSTAQNLGSSPIWATAFFGASAKIPQHCRILEGLLGADHFSMVLYGNTHCTNTAGLVSPQPPRPPRSRQ